MKNIIKLVVLLFLTVGYSQTGEVTYAIKSIKKDKLDHPMVKGVIKEYSLMRFELIYDKEYSYFKTNSNIPYNRRWYKFAKAFIESYNDWFQDVSAKESSYNKTIAKKTYQVIHNRMTDWEIGQETKNIQGYTCYKAIRKELNTRHRNPKNKYLTYIAWFTPDIPAPYGPIGNGGLPGLILQLEKPNLVVYTAEKIKLNTGKLKIPKIKDGKRIDSKEEQKLMRLARMVTPD